MIDKISKKIEDWNRFGICLPMVRDPKNGLGSITATMFWASFTMCLVAGLIFIVTALAHLTGMFAPGDATQEAVKNASQYFLELYLAAGSFYVGRKFQSKSDGTVNLDGSDSK